MGVLGVFPFLKRHKVPYTHYPTLEGFTANDPADTLPYYLDFSACFFHFVTTRVTSSVQFELNATFLVELIQQIPKVIVVFDGPKRSIEKWKTTMARYNKNMKDLESLEEKITLLNANNSRISTSKWKWLAKIEKRCKIMDKAFIERHYTLVVLISIVGLKFY